MIVKWQSALHTSELTAYVSNTDTPVSICWRTKYRISARPYTGAQLHLWGEAPAVTEALMLNLSVTGGEAGQFVSSQFLRHLR